MTYQNTEAQGSNTDYAAPEETGFPDLPISEHKTFQIRGKAIECFRQSGTIKGSTDQQHTQISTRSTYHPNGPVHDVSSSQWTTTKIRLAQADGKQKDIDLGFEASVQPGDAVSVIKLKAFGKDSWYTKAVQNHTTGQYYCGEWDLQLRLLSTANFLFSAKGFFSAYLVMVLLLVTTGASFEEAALGWALPFLFGYTILAYAICFLAVAIASPRLTRQLKGIYSNFSNWN